MKRYFLQILFSALTLLMAVSCDSDAHLVEYEDVLGIYQGQCTSVVTAGSPDYDEWIDMEKVNYGDTLLHQRTLSDTLLMAVEVDTDNLMSFQTSFPSIQLADRKVIIQSLTVEHIHTAIKGNRIVTWDIHDVTTDTTVLPLQTLYVRVDDIHIVYTEEDGGGMQQIVAKGYAAASLNNYTMQLHLMLTDAPGMIVSGCTLWLRYSGNLMSRTDL